MLLGRFLRVARLCLLLGTDKPNSRVLSLLDHRVNGIVVSMETQKEQEGCPPEAEQGNTTAKKQNDRLSNGLGDFPSNNEGWDVVPTKKQRNRDQRRRSCRPPPSPPCWWMELTSESTQEDRFDPFMLVLQGFPGSGKSTVASKLQEIMPWKYVRINQDELGNRKKCLARAKAALEEGMCPVIDRCNAGFEHRKPFRQLAVQQGCPVDCLVLELPRHECVQRCKARQDHPTVKPHQAEKVVGFMNADWKLPVAGEKFRNVWRVDVSAGNSQNQDDLRQVLELLLL